ncbi:MAG: OmpA family protein [Erythrobacter sp.]|uniref:OmpA family protein n=1 Tax=Erythrobacter sp. TaxID=1042 RepID=UPI00262381A6|nr:OmpA family protein [Erythrobacter sp.]MDJ0977235.1 OmpA family protein [Erythrobacter sp.]
MRAIMKAPLLTGTAAFGALALVAAAPSAAQPQPVDATNEDGVLVTGSPPADLSSFPEGPDIEGFVSARSGNKVEVTQADGTSSIVTVGEGTEIKASGGFLGLARDELGMDQILNGIPVKVETVQWGSGLVASKVNLKTRDLKTAQMIQTGTQQKFAQQGAKIGANTEATVRNAAATEALRGRFGDIDKYNIKGTTNVYFDTGKYALSPSARAELCDAAQQAETNENALLLVVGYTDSTGSYEINQELSEKRAGRVVNYLQQQCGWKPYRMLSPTGMAASDPTADNSTAEGRAQNRRVAVNVLVSKSVEEM